MLTGLIGGIRSELKINNGFGQVEQGRKTCDRKGCKNREYRESYSSKDLYYKK